jgi:hypothetical protein
VVVAYTYWTEDRAQAVDFITPIEQYRWILFCTGSLKFVYSRKVAGSISDQDIGFFNLPNPSIRDMALGSTRLLTEMSTRNLHEDKGRWPARKAHNLSTIWSRLSRKCRSLDGS